MAQGCAPQHDADLIQLRESLVSSRNAEDSLTETTAAYTPEEAFASSDRNERVSQAEPTVSMSSWTKMLSSSKRVEKSRSHTYAGEAPKFWRRFKRQDYWQLQLFTCALSLGLLVAILVIAIAFDGKPLPQWQYHITLNTIVSVLATLATFSLIVPVTAGLGQLKWIRFRQGAHRLSEFEAIDRASRGPTGSIVLLVKRRGGLLAIVGSLIILVNLATNPFFQQIIHYENRLVQSSTEEALMPICVEFDPSNLGIVAQTSNSDPVLGAIFSGVYTGDASVFQVSPGCATNNCTWNTPYHTLGVCSECKDISDQVQSRELESEGAESWYLPNGFSAAVSELNISNTYNNYNYPPDELASWSSVAFSDRGLVALDFFSIYVADTWEPTAYECVLQYCIKTYTAETKNGVFTEMLQGQWTNDSASARDLLTMVLSNYDSQNYSLTLTPPEQPTTFSISIADVYSLIGFFGWAFLGNTIAQGAGLPPGTDISYYLWQALRSNTSDDISSIFASLAASMTLYLRTYCNDTTTVGVAYAMETFVHIEYAWIALPATVYLLVVIFFGAVVLKSSRHNVERWGDGGLPVLFHGLDERCRARFGTLNRASAMDEAAEELVVKLAAGGHGLRLSAVEDEADWDH